MAVQVTCPTCSQSVDVDVENSGAQVQCPGCRRAFTLPTVKLAADMWDRVAPTHKLATGARVAGFEIESELASGGMGTVYVARQLSMDRRVALKVLPAGLASDPRNVERFQSEVRLQARLDHPNIVPAFEAGMVDGIYYLAMTYVDGESVAARLKRAGRLTEAQALQVALQTAEALDYAWTDHQILHRDVKPSNILLDRRGIVRLLDLGISKCLDDNAALTVSGVICGTPHYMSPEQAKGRPLVDYRADIYSLGATLYEMVTGEPPFDGISSLDVLHKHVYQPLPDPRIREPALSLDAAELIVWLMRKAPADRPADWHVVVDMLRGLQAGAGAASDLRAPASGVPVPGRGGSDVSASTSAGGEAEAAAMRATAIPVSPRRAPTPAPAQSGRRGQGAPSAAAGTIAARPTGSGDRVRDGLAWALKGLLVGCAVWGSGVTLLVGLLLYGVYSFFSGCSIGGGGSNRNTVVVASPLDTLDHLSGASFGVEGQRLVLKPDPAGSLWLSKRATAAPAINCRLRPSPGGEAGIVLWPTRPSDPGDAIAQGAHGGAELAIRLAEGGGGEPQLVVKRRDGDASEVLLALSIRPDADGWFNLNVARDGAHLTVTLHGGEPQSLEKVFAPVLADEKLTYPDLYWGVYATPGTAVEAEFPKDLPAAPPDTAPQAHPEPPSEHDPALKVEALNP